MDMNEKLQRALIDEGANEAEAEEWAGELDAMLSKAALPAMNKEKQAALMLMMRRELSAPKSLRERLLENYGVALLLSQVRVIQREIWAGSAILLSIGVLVTLSSPREPLFSFAALAPIVAAASVGLLYDSDFQAMLEIEETSRASARLLLLARLSLVFCFNLVITLIGSVVLAIFDRETLLLPLILSWLAPMTFLSGLAFFLSVTGRNTIFAGGFSLVLWIGHLVAPKTGAHNLFIQLISTPGLSEPSYRPMIMAVGVMMVLVALWYVGVAERHAHQNILD